MSIMSATGRGAQAGVLVKDAEALERFAEVDTLIVDKTGTLTEGRPGLTESSPLAGFEEGTCFARRGLERGSEHPLAAAIVADAERRGADAHRSCIVRGDHRQGRARQRRRPRRARSAMPR